MSLYKRGEVWWIAIRHRGGRIRRSARTADRENAQRQHDELKARLWQQKHSGRTLADALLAWTKAKPRSRSELNALKQIRRTYKDRRLVDVSEASLIEAFGEKSPGTYNKLIVIVRSALNMARRAGWIDAVPRIGKRKEPETAMRYLTAEQWVALRDELPEHLRAMAAFALATGLRWSNVSGLTWDRVSVERGIAWVEARDAKGKRAIQIPLSKTARTVLRGVSGPREGYVFTWRGKRVGSPKTAWRKAITRARLDGFRFHDLRHTWASWHAMGGTPADVLQKLGAWRTPAMVQRYTHLAPSYVAGFADNARPPSEKNVATKTVHSRKRKAA